MQFKLVKKYKDLETSYFFLLRKKLFKWELVTKVTSLTSTEVARLFRDKETVKKYLTYSYRMNPEKISFKDVNKRGKEFLVVYEK